MTAFVAYGGLRLRLFSALVLSIAVAALAGQRPTLAADSAPVGTVGEPITVHLDQAKLLKLPEKTVTLVIGNPLIADVAVQPGGIMVVTAKSYGITNLVALDRSGATLMDHAIHVVGPIDNVVLYRGVERESYSCTPNCERRIMLGDSQNYFNANLAAGTNLSTEAQGGVKK